jgi:hypothetical protein
MTVRGAPLARLRRLATNAGTAPLYPAIVPAAFVIDVWQKTGVDPLLLVRPIAIAVLAAASVTALALMVARNRHQGGLYAGTAAIGVIGGDDLRIAALAVVAIGLVALLVRSGTDLARRVPWPRVTSFLNLIAVVMLGILSLGAAGRIAGPDQAATQPVPAPTAGAPASQPPDIVVLLLDGHGRQDLLADRYGEDISGFVAALETRGFDVSGRSRSNYMSTQQTLASMFNYTHLSDLGLPPQTDPAFGPAAKRLLDHNKAYEVLKAAGYRTATVTPGYDGVSLRSSDVFIDGGQINELEAALITNTLLRPVLSVAAPDAFPSQIRDRVLWNLDPGNWLPGLVQDRPAERPFFLFIHVPSPHVPYVFGRDGGASGAQEIAFIDQTPYSSRTPEQVSVVSRAYADQLAYVDRLTIEALDKVLASVPSSSVVIVMADHGPDAHVDWDNLATTDTRERFGVLFAARTPDAPGLFGDAPTPVNFFPTLLNHYLRSDLPLRSNSSFIGVPPRNELLEIGDPDAGH